MPRCRERGFCCGARGARAVIEGKRGTRISYNRLNEPIDTNASGVAVACPFCVTMFEDGVRALNVEERFAVQDIAEIVAAALVLSKTYANEPAKKVTPPAGVSPVMNGYDAHALEAALRLREQLGGKVTVISLGPDST